MGRCEQRRVWKGEKLVFMRLNEEVICSDTLSLKEIRGVFADLKGLSFAPKVTVSHYLSYT